MYPDFAKGKNKSCTLDFRGRGNLELVYLLKIASRSKSCARSWLETQWVERAVLMKRKSLPCSSCALRALDKLCRPSPEETQLQADLGENRMSTS